MPIAQAALSAGLSWLVAVHVVGHHSPFFAPIAAVICLGVTPALRNTRVLVRRVVAALRDGEAMPDKLYEAIDQLADAVELLCTELRNRNDPVESSSCMQTVANLASPELIGNGGFSTGVVLAQLRSTAVDMLQATGMSRDSALAELPALNRRKE